MEPRTAHNTVSRSLIRWWTGLSRELQGPETPSDIPWGLVCLTLSSAQSLLQPLPLGVSWCNSIINVWKMWGKIATGRKKNHTYLFVLFGSICWGRDWIALLAEGLSEDMSQFELKMSWNKQTELTSPHFLIIFIWRASKELQVEITKFLTVKCNFALTAVLVPKEWKTINEKNGTTN